MNTLNEAGINLVKQAEGLKLTAYPDPATGGEPWTIGYGHTGGVKEGDIVTVEQANQLLELDLDNVVDAIQPLLKVVISDNAFSACVCFAFNVGVHNFANSTMLRLINAGNSGWAANEFLKWNHANGQVLPGLTARREAEKRLFEKI